MRRRPYDGRRRRGSWRWRGHGRCPALRARRAGRHGGASCRRRGRCRCPLAEVGKRRGHCHSRGTPTAAAGTGDPYCGLTAAPCRACLERQRPQSLRVDAGTGQGMPPRRWGPAARPRPGGPPGCSRGSPGCSRGTPGMLEGDPGCSRGTRDARGGPPGCSRGAPGMLEGDPRDARGGPPGCSRGTPGMLEGDPRDARGGPPGCSRGTPGMLEGDPRDARGGPPGCSRGTPPDARGGPPGCSRGGPGMLEGDPGCSRGTRDARGGPGMLGRGTGGADRAAQVPASVAVTVAAAGHPPAGIGGFAAKQAKTAEEIPFLKDIFTMGVCNSPARLPCGFIQRYPDFLRAGFVTQSLPAGAQLEVQEPRSLDGADPRGARVRRSPAGASRR
eukprot:gene23526-biopygen10357